MNLEDFKNNIDFAHTRATGYSSNQSPYEIQIVIPVADDEDCTTFSTIGINSISQTKDSKIILIPEKYLCLNSRKPEKKKTRNEVDDLKRQIQKLKEEIEQLKNKDDNLNDR